MNPITALSWRSIGCNMGEVITLYDATPVDPVLQKGDLVRIRDADTFVDCPDEAEWTEGICGIVIGIETTFGLDSETPGQAATVRIGIPQEDGWEPLEGIPIECLVRILGQDRRELQGYE